MVRWLTRVPQQDDIHYVELFGLSTDSKPAGPFATGSIFFEVDTSTAFFFDEESGEWIEAGGS